MSPMSSFLVSSRVGSRGHVLAVAKDGDPVGERESLVQAVADVDDADAVLLELADDLEEVVDLAQAQRGGGLVHDDDVRLVQEGLGDLDHLLLPDTQSADGGAWVDLEMEPGKQLARTRVHGSPFQQGSPVQLRAQEHVLRDGQLGDEVELLIDGHDARVDGLARGARGMGRPL